MPLLIVKNLRKYFTIYRGIFKLHIGEIKAVDGVSFEIYEKETLGLVGESGSGKTTLAHLILRLIEPTEGEVIFKTDNIRRDIQLVFQNPYNSLDPKQRVKDIIQEPMIIHRYLPHSLMSDKTIELLDSVGLSGDYINRFPYQLSGGQRQRVAIARAISLCPKLLVLDEPISSLDVSTAVEILDLLKVLKKRFGLSYLFISHDLNVIGSLSDRCLVMEQGRIVEQGKTEDVFKNPKDPYTIRLLESARLFVV